jgi:antitoxin (DNA-binding transcriptional repressor) of toxin-antitoxin stability system
MRESYHALNRLTGRKTLAEEKNCENPQNRYFGDVIVTATELANESKSILDRVIQGGEVVEIQRHGKTVALIQPRVGTTRTEILRLLRGRGFTAADSEELKSAMDSASEVIGYAGRD